MFEPALSPKVPTPNSKSNVISRTLDNLTGCYRIVQASRARRRLRTEPTGAEIRIFASPQFWCVDQLSKWRCSNVSSKRQRDFQGPIRAVRVKDVDVVRPRHRLETSRQVLSFVLCKNENGNHLSKPSFEKVFFVRGSLALPTGSRLLIEEVEPENQPQPFRLRRLL